MSLFEILVLYIASAATLVLVLGIFYGFFARDLKREMEKYREQAKENSRLHENE